MLICGVSVLTASHRGSYATRREEAQEAVSTWNILVASASSLSYYRIDQVSHLDPLTWCPRAANRRSASSSRARKKKYIEKLTSENRRLKRISRILAILPDLVMVVNEECRITFASWRSQKMLQVRTCGLEVGTARAVGGPRSIALL
jgi:hypothetical protein